MAGGGKVAGSTAAENKVYFAIGIYVLALGLIGFARNFYLAPFGAVPLHDAGPINAGTVIHGFFCTAWLGLAAWQPWLIMRGQFKTHRTSGRWGGLIAILLIFTGLYVAFAQAIRFAQTDGPVGFFAVPVGIIIGFTIAFAIAMYFRKRPDWHKRWIVIAHAMILEPAAARALSTFNAPVFPAILLLICAPILLGLAFDATRRKQVPWLYLLGLVIVITSGFARQSLARDPDWAAWVAAMLG